MTKRAGILSSIGLLAAILCYIVSMLFGSLSITYLSGMLLSWFYVLMVCCLSAEILPERKGLAFGAIAFACIFTVFMNLVYFTQLTAVSNRTLPDAILEVLSLQKSGSLMYYLDLLGYGMLSISALLIGFALKPAGRADRWLRGILIVQAIFATGCILISMGCIPTPMGCIPIPIFTIFKAPSGDSIGTVGNIIFVLRAIYLLPAGILSLIHFKNSVTLYR